MGKMLILIVAVLFGFIGSGKGLLKAWILFLCAVFSIYPAVWGLPEISAQLNFFPKEAEPYKNLILILAVWILLEVIFHHLVSKYLSDPEVYEFPALLNKIGGILFGALAGLLFLGVCALAIATSPLSGKIPSLTREDFVQISGTVIPKLTASVDRFSMQSSSTEKEKFLTTIYFKEEIPESPKEETEKTEDSKAAKAKTAGKKTKQAIQQTSDDADDTDETEEIEETEKVKKSSAAKAKTAGKKTKQAIKQTSDDADVTEEIKETEKVKKSSAAKAKTTAADQGEDEKDETDSEESRKDSPESVDEPAKETGTGIRTPTAIPFARKATAKIQAMAAEEQEAVQKEALAGTENSSSDAEELAPAEQPAKKTTRKSVRKTRRRTRAAQ